MERIDRCPECKGWFLSLMPKTRALVMGAFSLHNHEREQPPASPSPGPTPMMVPFWDCPTCKDDGYAGTRVLTWENLLELSARQGGYHTRRHQSPQPASD